MILVYETASVRAKAEQQLCACALCECWSAMKRDAGLVSVTAAVSL